MNEQSENLDLKNLEQYIKTKTSEISELESRLNKYLASIEKHERKITASCKTFFEKVIEALSIGFIKYDRKYTEIIHELKTKILEISNTINVVDKDLQLKNEEIFKLKEEFNNKLNTLKLKLEQFQSNLIKLAEFTYINDCTKTKLIIKLNNIVGENSKYILHDNIKSSINELIAFIKSPEEWIFSKNLEFVKNEKIREKQFFDTIESNPLTEKQKDAVLVNENNNLILAGAGSGKTSVIVAKVVYLLKKNILHPNELLILAFNKNAQVELSDRFKEKGLHVKIKTFHSFGLGVIAKAMAQKPNLCSITESQTNMTKFIKDTIHNLMASMSVFLENFLDFVAYLSIPYKSESEFNSLGEYYDYQSSYDMETLKHEVKVKEAHQGENKITLKKETVKSHQELLIANSLTLNGIKYLYEEPYKYKTSTIKKGQYRPDFYLPEYDLYIEHFGIDKNNNTASYIDNKEYLDDMEWKIEQHKKNNTILVQTFSYEFTERNSIPLLKEKLLPHNVIFRKLNYAEMLELIKQSNENDRFTKLFTSFLTHYKSNMHTLDEIKEKSKSERSSLFIKLFEFIFKEYRNFQERYNCIDFDDMIIKALNAIDNHKYKHGFKHIFIDEFQDISTTRATLIKKLLLQGDVSLTAVGDDWQSINRFAGGNIKIIGDFKKMYGVSKTIALDYTFRFNDKVSKIASDFVQKNPHQIKKTIQTVKRQKSDEFSILLFWNTGDIQSDLIKIIDFIASKEKNTDQKQVLVLARYNFLLTNKLKNLKKKYPNLNIIFSTVHSSKGNEADYVIVLNLNKGEFGFPSKIEDDPILNMVIPEGDEFEDAEERRLFYVALTRTKEAVFLLSDRYNKSPFIDEFIENYKDDIFFINDPKIRVMNCPECKTGVLRKRIKPRDKNKSFYGCSNFPRCKYTEDVHYCPECNEEILKNIKEGMARCTSDSCDFERILCIECGGYMIERDSKYGLFLGCENFPKCTHKSNIIEKNSINFDNLF